MPRVVTVATDPQELLARLRRACRWEEDEVSSHERVPPVTSRTRRVSPGRVTLLRDQSHVPTWPLSGRAGARPSLPARKGTAYNPIRRFRRTCIVGAVAILGLSFGAWADDPATSSSAISSEELNETIGRVIEQSQYAWRLPREVPPDTEKGFVTLFIESVVGVVKDVVDWVTGGVKRFTRWLRDKLPGRSDGSSAPWGGLAGAPQMLMYILLTAATVLLMIWAIRLVRQRTRTHHVQAEPAPDLPDIEAEETTADELPEDGWLTLARDLLERGEPRLALRALFLATLARLDGIQLIRIARFKSNRDYLRELERRARTEPDLRLAFLENMGLFESVWYGAHEPTPERVHRFTANQDRIHPRG